MKLVARIEPSIFRGYDIRGVMDQDLNEDVYYTLGRAYATFLARRRITDSAVGYDNRLNSLQYAQAFIAGLNEGGINTVDIGLTLSQIVYFSAYLFRFKGSAMITASHNPKEFNGLKLGVGYSDTMITQEIQELKQIATESKFSTGKGNNRQQDIFAVYAADVLSHFKLGKRWKVVVDACNTGAGVFMPKLLREAGCEVIEQNTTPDGNFPLGVPDPTEVTVVKRLAKGVVAAQAHIGFGYDADGDRMAVVDAQGNIIWMDSIVALFAQDVLDFLPGAPIVFNTLCSRQVIDAIEKNGGRGVMWLTGHSFIKAKVKEERAPFGGELSGHIFFMDNFYGHDDSAYASLRLLAYLERKQQSLSEAVARLNHYVSSPEIKLGLADKIKFKFVDEILRADFKAAWPQGKYIDIDGIRVDYSDKMAIVRASQNGPYITAKFEGKTQALYDQMKQTLGKILHSHREIDWNKGTNTHAFE